LQEVVEQIREHYPELIRGYRMTIYLTLLSMALAVALGFVVSSA
jgi:hypothetical protein